MSAADQRAECWLAPESLCERRQLPDGHFVYQGRAPNALIAAAEFEALWLLHPAERSRVRIRGRWLRIARFQQAYERDYRFSGQTAPAGPAPAGLQPFLRWAQAALDARLNGLLVNWYDGAQRHYIGPHHDDVRDLVPGTPIVTISLGEERVFRLSRPTGRQQGLPPVELSAAPGSVIVIPWQTNLAWKHSVPHLARYRGRRISITLRAFT